MTESEVDMEKRLYELEKKLPVLEMTTTTHAASTAKDISEIKEVMKDMAISLQSLAVWEERHSNLTDTIKRIFKAIEKSDERLERLEKMENAIQPLRISIAELNKKMSAIEPHIPNMKLATGWVFKAVLALVSLETLALLFAVIKYLNKV